MQTRLYDKYGVRQLRRKYCEIGGIGYPTKQMDLSWALSVLSPLGEEGYSALAGLLAGELFTRLLLLGELLLSTHLTRHCPAAAVGGGGARAGTLLLLLLVLKPLTLSVQASSILELAAVWTIIRLVLQ